MMLLNGGVYDLCNVLSNIEELNCLKVLDYKSGKLTNALKEHVKIKHENG